MIDVLVVRAIAAALLLAAGAWGGYSWRDSAAVAELGQLQAGFEKERTGIATAQTRAVEKARTEERRVAFRIQEIADASHLRALQMQDAARRSDAEHRSLRDDLAVTRNAYRALAAADSTAAEECRAAFATAAVCADVLGQCSERRQELADYADRAAAAGQTCVGAYRALRPPDIRLGGSP